MSCRKKAPPAAPIASRTKRNGSTLHKAVTGDAFHGAINGRRPIPPPSSQIRSSCTDSPAACANGPAVSTGKLLASAWCAAAVGRTRRKKRCAALTEFQLRLKNDHLSSDSEWRPIFRRCVDPALQRNVAVLLLRHGVHLGPQH